MAEIGELDLRQIKTDLIIAQRECYERRLINASKWAAEISNTLDVSVDPRQLKPQDESEVIDWFGYLYSGNSVLHQASPGPLRSIISSTYRKAVQLFEFEGPRDVVIRILREEYDRYVLAKCYFDLKEYDRAVHTLRDCTSSKPNFLRLYALYMSDQKRKADNMPDSNAQVEPFENEVLKILQNELSEKSGKKELDGFGLYLYGVVLIKLDLPSAAISILVQAITMEPLNWSAWMELARLISDRETLMSLKLPSHWIKSLFMAKVYMELQLHDNALLIYKAFMEKGFGECAYIVAQIAVTHHDMRDVDQAVLTFKHLVKMEPYRMENMDIYSNLLYVKDAKSELAHLAHHCCSVNKYCVETCCVIGNYYSYRSQHEKSVLYFQRALKLNCNYISAWTLMGHEYMEMKNTSAAIQAYRRAIEVDKRDYRAWYGLGQTYEILKMPSYSLYYYRQAQTLKPNDSRMVFALGECYQKLSRLEEAKKCYWKAHCLGDVEEVALVRLANLYHLLHEEEQACLAFTKYIAQADRLKIHNHEDLSQAYRYLANYHYKHENLDEAYAAAQKCSEFTETREEAKTLLRMIQNKRGQDTSSTSNAPAFPDDSLDSIAQTDLYSQGAARTFGRVTPINLKFTP